MPLMKNLVHEFVRSGIKTTSCQIRHKRSHRAFQLQPLYRLKELLSEHSTLGSRRLAGYPACCDP